MLEKESESGGAADPEEIWQQLCVVLQGEMMVTTTSGETIQIGEGSAFATPGVALQNPVLPVLMDAMEAVAVDSDTVPVRGPWAAQQFFFVLVYFLFKKFLGVDFLFEYWKTVSGSREDAPVTGLLCLTIFGR